MLTILAKLRPGTKYSCPTWRVQCGDCGETYLLTAWRPYVLRARRCGSCDARRREGVKHELRKYAPAPPARCREP